MIRKLHSGTFAEYLSGQTRKGAPKVVQSNRAERVAWFRSRFAGINRCKAICLGARLGEEVEALKSLGFVASGVDLVAHPPFVLRGDMNERLAGQYGLIYTNAFDHCFDPQSFLKNIRSALTRDGLCLMHLSDGQAGKLESIEWDSIDDIAELAAECGFKLYPVAIEEFYGLKFEAALMPVRRKVFIDAGSYNGDTTQIFWDRFPNASEYEVHCFEPDPRFFGTKNGATFHPVAVSTWNGVVDLYVGKPQSSSVIREKTSGNLDRDNPVRVRCIDFTQWLLDNFDPCDEIVLKMNIEGAEYDVLEMMLAWNAFRNVTRLFIDWHYDRVGVPRSRHEALVKKIDALGIPVESLGSGFFLGERVG